MLEDATKYLERVVPWDGTHYINIHRKRQGLGGLAFLNISDAIVYLKYLVKREDHHDIYLALSANNECGTKANITSINPRAVRLAKEVYGSKCFYVDLDVKENSDKGYPDTRTAVVTFNSILKATNFPMPNVTVLSGTGGVHVYWTMPDVLGPDDWYPRAHALANMLQENGLKFDSQCTVDLVRVLRIPETYNAKTDPYSEVRLVRCEPDQLLEPIDVALGPYFGKKITVEGKEEANDDLSSGVETKTAALRDIADVASNCPFIANTLTSGGKEHNEPLWFSSLTVAHYCNDSEEVAKSLSDKHEQFNQEELNEKIEIIKQSRLDNSKLGWPSCKSIQGAGAKECAGCPRLIDDRSPLFIKIATFTKATPTSNPIMNLPRGYFQGLNGHIYKKGKPKEGDEIVIPYKVTDIRLLKTPWEIHMDCIINNTSVDIKVPFKEIAKQNELTSILYEQGLAFHDSKRMKDFMTSFIQQLQEAKAAIATTQSYGWYEADGVYDGFVYNGMRYTKDGPRRASLDRGLELLYSVKGDPQPWMDLSKYMSNLNQPSLDMFLAAAFAGPLVEFTGERGFTLGGWSSDSGIGKTTMHTLACAVWASPDAMAGQTDTANSIAGRLGRLKSIPMVWDEIKTIQEQETFSKLIMELNRGIEKGRMTRDTELRRQGTWRTLIAYAANTSMADVIMRANKTTQAGSMRLFEVVVPPLVTQPTTEEKEYVRKLIVDIGKNYGHAGVAYAEYLGRNTDAVRNFVNKQCSKVQEELSSTTSERNWAACIAVLLCGVIISNSILKLTNINLPVLKEYLYIEFGRMRRERLDAPNDLSRSENVESLLGNFLSEKRARNTLFTDTICMTAGKPAKGSIKVLGEPDVSRRLEALQVQIAVIPKVIRIDDIPLSAWLEQRKIQVISFHRAIETIFGAKKKAGLTLGSGTEYAATMKSYVWELALGGTKFGDEIEWSTGDSAEVIQFEAGKIKG